MIWPIWPSAAAWPESGRLVRKALAEADAAGVVEIVAETEPRSERAKVGKRWAVAVS